VSRAHGKQPEEIRKRASKRKGGEKNLPGRRPIFPPTSPTSRKRKTRAKILFYDQESELNQGPGRTKEERRNRPTRKLLLFREEKKSSSNNPYKHSCDRREKEREKKEKHRAGHSISPTHAKGKKRKQNGASTSAGSMECRVCPERNMKKEGRENIRPYFHSTSHKQKTPRHAVFITWNGKKGKEGGKRTGGSFSTSVSYAPGNLSNHNTGGESYLGGREKTERGRRHLRGFFPFPTVQKKKKEGVHTSDKS